MGLVERVAGKRLPVLPDLLERVGVVAALVSALEELGLHLGDQVALLLAHRLPQRVGLTLGEAGELLRQQHDLLLVHGDAVGLREVLLAGVEVVLDRFLAMLPADKRRDVLQRSGTVERVHGDQVRKLRRLEVLQVPLHADRLVLENADRVPALEQLIRGGVVERERLRVELHATAALDVADRILDDGQRLEPEEVHLEQTGVLRDGVVELRAHHVAVLGRGDRDELGDVVRGDDDPAGVDARVADRALDDAGLLEHLRFEAAAVVDGLDGVDLIEPLLSAELLLEGLVVQLEKLGERDVGHLLGQAVSIAQRQLHDAGRVPDGTLGRHRAVGDDLGHLVRPVFLDDVIDDLAAALVVEVDVDVRQGHPVGVQEPLEQEVVGDGVHVGDAGAIGHGGAGRRSPARPHADAEPSGLCGEVLDDEEVPRVAGALDGLELEVQPLTDLVGDRLVALLGALVGEVAQVGVLSPLPAVLGVFGMHELRRDVKGRQQHIPLQFKALAPVHDVAYGVERLRQVREELLHLLRRLQVELVVGQSEAELAAAATEVFLGLADVGRILHAEQDVVGIGLDTGRVVAVVGRHVADAVLAAEPEQEIVDHLLLLQSMAVELGVEMLAEMLLPPQKGLLGLAVPHIEQEAGYLAEQTAGEHDQVLLVLEQLVAVDAGHVIEAVRVGQRAELGEAVVAGLVAGNQDNGVAVVLLRAVGVVAADVELGPDDRLDAGLVGRPDELEGAHHVAVVGDRQRGHAEFGRLGRQHLHAGGGLQHAELAVDVQVAERNGLQRHCIDGRSRPLGRSRGHFGFGSGLVEVGGLQLGRFVAHAFTGREAVALDDPALDEGEKALGRRVHVVGRVVGVAEAFPEELLVQFGQGRPLEFAATAAWNRAELRRLVLGIDERLVRHAFGRSAQADPLCPDDVDVELDVVAHHVVRPIEVAPELLHDVGQRQSHLLGALGGDAVDLGRVVGNREAVGPHDAVAARHEFAVGGVQLPGELNQPGPILAVGQGGIPIPGQARGLRIVDENHGRASSHIAFPHPRIVDTP